MPSPVSPYGMSKLMSERILQDASTAHPLSYMILRYFNVAGADPNGRLGQSTPGATHLIKVALETAFGRRPAMSIFGDDYPTPDGTCVRILSTFRIWQTPISPHSIILQLEGGRTR